MELKTMPSYTTALFHPHPALQPYIESYYVLSPSFSKLTSIPWHIMPDGAAHILLHIYRTKAGSSFQSRLTFVGPRSTHVFTDRKQRILSLIARLKPGTNFLPLAYPFCDLKDQADHLEALLACDLSKAREEMTTLGGSGRIDALVQRFDALMLSFYDSGIRQQALVHNAVQWIDQAGGQVSMKTLSSSLGVSDRHLRSMFNKAVGLSPKRYARIVRLTKTVKMVDKGMANGWAQLALSAGYYDQSHMIEDFHALVGESPSAFISRTNREELLTPASDFSNT